MSELVTVEKYQFLPQAETARMAMASEGIDAILIDAETVSTDWALGNAIGYIKLQVPMRQVEAAEAILRHMRQQREARGTNLETADKCLACGAVFQPRQTTCTECGWTFANESAELVDDDQDADVPAESQSPSDPSTETSHEEEGARFTNAMLAWNRPLIIMTLIPIGASAAVVLLYILTTVLRLITG